jgi:sec-independent protein translocase protein TatC
MSNGKQGTTIDPEDMFNDTRMNFGDHLEDLRTHLWRAIKGFMIAMVFAMCIGKYAVEFITAPVNEQLKIFNARVGKKRADDLRERSKEKDYYIATSQVEVNVKRDDMRAAVGLPPLVQAAQKQSEPVLGTTIRGFEAVLEQLGVADLIDRRHIGMDTSWAVLKLRIDDPAFRAKILEDATSANGAVKTFNVTEAFMVYFKVSFVTGLLIGSPWIFIQIWAFIAAGLYPHEKKLVNVYLPFSVFLFLGGAAMCQFVVMPRAIKFLLSFNDWMGLEPDLRLNEWLSFALWMPVIFGASFQTPMVMVFLNKLGFADVSTFRKHRKIAWFAMAVFAVVIAPSPDALSPLFMWVPMGFLYELGILMCAWQSQTPFDEVETPPIDRMVEV